MPIEATTPSGHRVTLSPEEEMAATRNALEQRVFDKISSRLNRRKALFDSVVSAIGSAIGLAIGGFIIGSIVKRSNNNMARGNDMYNFTSNPLDDDEADSLLDDARWFGDQYDHFRGEDPEREGYYYGMTSAKADVVLRFSDDPEKRKKALDRLYATDEKYYVER